MSPIRVKIDPDFSEVAARLRAAADAIDPAPTGPGTERCTKACSEGHEYDETCALGPEAEREATEQPPTPTPAPTEDVVDEPGVGAVFGEEARHRDIWGPYGCAPTCPVCHSANPATPLVTPAPPTPAPQPTPAPAEDVVDEPGVGAVVRDRTGEEWKRLEVFDGWAAEHLGIGGWPWSDLRATYGPLTLVTPARPTPAPQPDTAPDEGAVEALARVYHRWTWPSWAWKDGTEKRLVALAFAREALSAIPGYGPTGASGGAGEVGVQRRDLADAVAVLSEIPQLDPVAAPLRAALDAS